MAVQLSSYLWLRNNTLMFLIDPRNKNHDAVPRDFSNEDRIKLKDIVDKIDGLHEPVSTHYHDKTPINKEHVLLTRGVTKIVERSINPQKSGRLFGQMHKIFTKYNLPESTFVKIYEGLGEAYSEIGLEPKGKIKRAVNYAEDLKNNPKSRDGSATIFWEHIFASKKLN
ncbi:MAG: hypothetical protein WCX73_04145 [Candidatus Pacearchaeota archaeon]|jgi:hypothetical protein